MNILHVYLSPNTLYETYGFFSSTHGKNSYNSGHLLCPREQKFIYHGKMYGYYDERILETSSRNYTTTMPREPIENHIFGAPVDGSTNISTSTSIVVTFAQPLSLTSLISMGPCTITCPSYGTTQTGSNTVLTYTDVDPLEEGTTYTVVLSVVNNLVGDDIYVWSFTTASAPHHSQGGGGGGSMSPDYCPYGDSSASFYDHVCGNKTKAQNIVDKLTVKWADRSADRIQSTLNVLIALNLKIQVKASISDELKALFQEIIDLLVAMYH